VNWIREPTNHTINCDDYGAGPQSNYTQTVCARLISELIRRKEIKTNINKQVLCNILREHVCVMASQIK